MNNKNFRLAIAHSIDVKSTIISLSRGFSKAAKSPLPPTNFIFDPSIHQFDFDIRQAKSILSKLPNSNQNNQYKIKLCYFIQTDTLRADPLCQSIKSQLEKLNIEIEIKPYINWEAFKQDIIIDKKFDLLIYGWPIYIKSADNFLYALFHSQSDHNIFNYSNRYVDQLLLKARKVNDRNRRKIIYKKIQEFIIQDIPAIFLSHPSAGFAINKKIKNIEIEPNMIVRLNNIEIAD